MITTICVIVCIINSILLILYRRQIKSICRQLAFLRKHDTNMRITQQTDFRSVRHLSAELNELLKERKQLEQEYRQKEEQQREMLTNLSHDIRTPLTSLDGYFQLFQESDLEVEKELYARIIRERTESLKEMLEELFTYTKLKNQVYDLADEEIEAVQVVSQAIFSFYEDFKQKGIEPVIELPEKQLWISGDKAALKRVIHNIVKNGLTHGTDSFVLRMKEEAGGVSIEAENQTDREIDLEQIFERFYKEDSARSVSSTGLGLAIARELVVKMGGTIEVEQRQNLFCIRVRLKK